MEPQISDLSSVRFSAVSEPVNDPELPMFTCRVKVFCHGGMGSKSVELAHVGRSLKATVERVRTVVEACPRRAPRVKQAILDALNLLEAGSR